jgi:hypothetical protein
MFKAWNTFMGEAPASGEATEMNDHDWAEVGRAGLRQLRW